jgi:hypothetical protein
MDIVFKICRTCNQSKAESEFRVKRRVCKKCVSQANAIKYKDVIKKYYADNQEKIIERSMEFHRQKMLKQGYKKKGRKRTINVNKNIETETINESPKTENNE